MLDAALIVKIVAMYLCGSIPTGLLLTRCLLKKDIRGIGSEILGRRMHFELVAN